MAGQSNGCCRKVCSALGTERDKGSQLPWLQSVLHCTAVAGLCCWFEMNVNLGETIKSIFPENSAIK